MDIIDILKEIWNVIKVAWSETIQEIALEYSTEEIISELSFACELELYEYCYRKVKHWWKRTPKNDNDRPANLLRYIDIMKGYGYA